MLKKPIILTLLMAGYAFLTILLISILDMITGIKETSNSIGLLVPFIVGQQYRSKYNEEIPKSLKTKTSLYYLILLVLWGYFTNIQTNYSISLIIFAYLVELFIIYWGLSIGSKPRKSLKQLIPFQSKSSKTILLLAIGIPVVFVLLLLLISKLLISSVN